MTRTGSVVTLEVAKQGAIYHGLATLLNQPSPMMQRGKCYRVYPECQVVEMNMVLVASVCERFKAAGKNYKL